MIQATINILQKIAAAPRQPKPKEVKPPSPQFTAPEGVHPITSSKPKGRQEKHAGVMDFLRRLSYVETPAEMSLGSIGSAIKAFGQGAMGSIAKNYGTHLSRVEKEALQTYIDAARTAKTSYGPWLKVEQPVYDMAIKASDKLKFKGLSDADIFGTQWAPGSLPPEQRGSMSRLINIHLNDLQDRGVLSRIDLQALDAAKALEANKLPIGNIVDMDKEIFRMARKDLGAINPGANVPQWVNNEHHNYINAIARRAVEKIQKTNPGLPLDRLNQMPLSGGLVTADGPVGPGLLEKMRNNPGTSIIMAGLAAGLAKRFLKENNHENDL